MTRLSCGSMVSRAHRYVVAAAPQLIAAKNLEFGPDGNLYVADNLSDTIVRFNGSTATSWMSSFRLVRAGWQRHVDWRLMTPAICMSAAEGPIRSCGSTATQAGS